MTIRSVKAIPVSLPFEMGGPKPLFAGIPRQMDIPLIRVETNAGQVGWGEAFGLTVRPATRTAFQQLIAPLVVGRDESDIASISDSLQRQLHLLGRTGPVMFALSGLDIALWDLAGKAAGKPLSALLGGARHTTLPLYASLMHYGDPTLVARNAAAACARGYRAIKLHEVSSEQVRAARAAIGPHVDLMMDVNCPWTVQQSLDMADQVRSSELRWFEEPLWPPEDFEGLARIRQHAGIAIAADENTMSAQHFAQMFDVGAVDYAQSSVTKIGGVTEFMKVVQLASRYNIPIMPHSPYFGPGLLATLHITSTFAVETTIEHSYAELDANPLGEAIEMRDGRIRVPDGPGLGRDPDPDVVSRYRLD